MLVDTCVWIGWLRGRDRAFDALGAALARDDVVLLGPVVTELLVGARGERERERVLALAEATRSVPLDLDLWTRAGDLGRRWRERGRALGVTDLLLAAAAQRDDLTLWTVDDDFEPLFEAGEIRRSPSL
jgi:predicted nucleic acid-binding protein